MQVPVRKEVDIVGSLERFPGCLFETSDRLSWTC
jgi:hypothetical protein